MAIITLISEPDMAILKGKITCFSFMNNMCKNSKQKKNSKYKINHCKVDFIPEVWDGLNICKLININQQNRRIQKRKYMIVSVDAENI